MRRDRLAWLLPAAVALLLAVAVWWQYGPTLSYGFVYDDYHFVRPYDRAELAAVFHGSWDATSIERPFYRPLTVAFYATRFQLLRFDAQAYHALSLALFTLAGALGAWLVARLSQSITAALWFAAFWVVHPNLPISLVAWTTNQMHLLQTIVCLSAFVYWSHVKARGAIWWTPLLVLQVMAFLVKEDGALLLPTLFAAHVLYRAMVDRQLRWPPAGIVIASVLLLAALLFARHQALGGLGGYTAPPTRAAMWANVTKGLARAVFLRPARLPMLQWQAWFVALALPLGAVAAAWRARRDPRGGPAPALLFLMACGLLIAVAFNLPFALVSKAEQYYLVATGAIIALAAAVEALTRMARPSLRPAVILAAIVTLVTMQETSRGLAAGYAPGSDETRRTDLIVSEWAAVPQEVRDWLPVKLIAPNTGDLARDLPCVTYGLYGPEKDFYHRVYRWTTGHVRLFVYAPASFVSFSLQPLLIERPRRPFTVRVSAEGVLVAEQTLTTEATAGFSIPLPRVRPGSARMRQVDLDIDHTWTPGPADPRLLGVKMYDLSCRAKP